MGIDLKVDRPAGTKDLVGLQADPRNHWQVDQQIENVDLLVVLPRFLGFLSFTLTSSNPGHQS